MNSISIVFKIISPNSTLIGIEKKIDEHVTENVSWWRCDTASRMVVVHSQLMLKENMWIEASTRWRMAEGEIDKRVRELGSDATTLAVYQCVIAYSMVKMRSRWASGGTLGLANEDMHARGTYLGGDKRLPIFHYGGWWWGLVTFESQFFLLFFLGLTRVPKISFSCVFMFSFFSSFSIQIPLICMSTRGRSLLFPWFTSIESYICWNRRLYIYLYIKEGNIFM